MFSLPLLSSAPIASSTWAALVTLLYVVLAATVTVDGAGACTVTVEVSAVRCG